MSLENKKLIFIGGSSGIGLASAKAAVAVGAHAVIASRSESKLKDAETEIGRTAPPGGNILTYALDVTREQDLQRFFDWVGPFDHLVTTAADVTMGPFLDTESPAARASFDSKFWGQYLAARYGAPKIRAGGSITFFAGVASRRPIPGFSCIAAINGAIEALARSLALELAPIRVNVVSPGPVATPVYEFMPESQRKAYFDSLASRLPVRRAGTAEDLAEAVLFLIQNDYSTGAVFVVDGGFSVAC
jgi:NAD(P)-dependent dehydrogenase (short-subunit alcohol dehydrogenase family)